ncbi:RNB family domain-containing protein [Besnoitia besnoiti]|uniref:RNB family domain-containing protein n=1 Tax=Besnoitia besnoiti TaxID=94643 RepID=A0A2A9MCB7_BESBE|nr:RNB family domain-containing protein [Besnoitia besnoiti]PFH33032.1 RNB family domain-containing protein [Besnoitia besnoiti]
MSRKSANPPPSSASDREKQFEEYVSAEEARAGLESGRFVKGSLRVNARQPNDAYVYDGDDVSAADFLIAGRRDRNRAVHGDTVFLQVHDYRQWKLYSDAFSFCDSAEVTGPRGPLEGDAKDPSASARKNDSPTEAECLQLVKEGRMLRTARVVFVETRALTDSEKEHLLPPLAEEPRGRADALPKDEKRLDSEEHPAAGAQPAPAREALSPPWMRRRLLRNRQFICTLRANNMRYGVAPEDDTLVRPNATLLRAIPLDSRINWILVPLKEAQKWEKLPGPLDKQRLYLVNVDAWDVYNILPRGSLLAYIGAADSIQTIERFCMMNNDLQIHMLPHSTEILEETDAIVERAEKEFEEEAKKRVDLRGRRRVLTIDPASARDLDDAVHLHRVPPSCWTGHEPEFEIGVHIADVSHFLQPLCRTDEEARNRCTTVYLKHVVFPMLPRALCDALCSLHPGWPKLTFSVTFRVREDGSLVEAWRPRFYRSVIESCCRFNYDEVQVLIDEGDIPEQARPLVSQPSSAPELTLADCGCFVSLSSCTRQSAPHSLSFLSTSSHSSSSLSPEERRARETSCFPFSPYGDLATFRACCGRCAACCRCAGAAEENSQKIAKISQAAGGAENVHLTQRAGSVAPERGAGKRASADACWEAIVEDLKLLDKLTTAIRSRRFESGSIMLHKMTLRFELDARSQPIGWTEEEHARSHSLIEELMLLANCLVARRLIDSPFADLAVLRSHSALAEKQVKPLSAFLSKRGISSDFSSSKAVQVTLGGVQTSHGVAAAVAVEALLRKSLKLALYYVRGDTQHPHFALNFTEYTHFTSPIRRYADVLVHRLLACALEWERVEKSSAFASSPSSSSVSSSSLPEAEAEGALSPTLLDFRKQMEAATGSREQLEEICGLCNAKKLNSKNAQQCCGHLFLSVLLKARREPYATAGVVLLLQDKSLVAFLPLLDKEQRITFQGESARSQVFRPVPDDLQKTVQLPADFRLPNGNEVEVTWVNPATNEVTVQKLQAFSPVPVYALPTTSVPPSLVFALISPFSPDFGRVKATENAVFSRFLHEAVNRDGCSQARKRGEVVTENVNTDIAKSIPNQVYAYS